MSNEQFIYDPTKHETTIAHNYSLKVLNMGNAEVPMVLKTWYPFRETENPEYRLKTDNRFLQLDFIFDNQEDADTLYNLLKKGTLRRVQRLTGRFKEEEATHIDRDIPTWYQSTEEGGGKPYMRLEDYPKYRIVYPDHVRRVSK